MLGDLLVVLETNEALQKIITDALAKRRGLVELGLLLLQFLFVEVGFFSAPVFVDNEMADGALVAVVEGEVVGPEFSSFDDGKIDSSQFEEQFKYFVAMVDDANHEWSEALSSLIVDGFEILFGPFLVDLFEEGSDGGDCVKLGADVYEIPVGAFDSDIPVPGDYFLVDEFEELAGAVLGD